MIAMMLGLSVCAIAQTLPPVLLVLEKEDSNLAIVDPSSLKVLARAPAGKDPHEVVASADGRFAYITNYGAFGTPLHTLSVVDLKAQKSLAPVELGPFLAPHGIDF